MTNNRFRSAFVRAFLILTACSTGPQTNPTLVAAPHADIRAAVRTYVLKDLHGSHAVEAADMDALNRDYRKCSHRAGVLTCGNVGNKTVFIIDSVMVFPGDSARAQVRTYASELDPPYLAYSIETFQLRYVNCVWIATPNSRVRTGRMR